MSELYECPSHQLTGFDSDCDACVAKNATIPPRLVFAALADERAARLAAERERDRLSAQVTAAQLAEDAAAARAILAEQERDRLQDRVEVLEAALRSVRDRCPQWCPHREHVQEIIDRALSGGAREGG